MATESWTGVVGDLGAISGLAPGSFSSRGKSPPSFENRAATGTAPALSEGSGSLGAAERGERLVSIFSFHSLPIIFGDIRPVDETNHNFGVEDYFKELEHEKEGDNPLDLVFGPGARTFEAFANAFHFLLRAVSILYTVRSFSLSQRTAF